MLDAILESCGKCGMLTLGVLNDSWGLALHHSDGGVCGTQVNTNDLALDLLVGIAPSE